MKASPKASRPETDPTDMAKAVELGLAAAKRMTRELRAEHRRWNMPLLSWKNGRVVAEKR